MNKKVLSLATMFILLSLVHPTPEASTQICLYCDHGNYTTATIAGSGGNCTDAQSALTSQLQSIARSYCQNNFDGFSYCNFSVVVTAACTQVSPGFWQVKGYARHSCRLYFC